MARRGQSQAPYLGADSRSAGFPPIPSPTPHPPISPVSPPSRASQSTLFLALSFKCRLRVCRKKIPLTQEMGFGAELDFASTSMAGEAVPELRIGLGQGCP